MNRAVLLMLVSALGACDRSVAPGAVASPELVLLDSVELRDPNDAPIGTPGDLLALADGRVLLADPQNFRLLEYDARGELVRSIGKKGSGPGEFQQIGPIALDGDSLLHVLEPSVLQTLEFRTGSFVQRVKIPAPFATSVGAQDGAVYFRTLDSAQRRM